MKRGFTLIEILVAVTLVLGLSGFMVAGFRGFNENQLATQAASTVKSNLIAARTDALSGKKPAGCDVLAGYRVTITSINTYTSQALCRIGLVEPVNTYTLPTGVTFSSIPAPFDFAVITGRSSRDETLTLASSSKTVTITIATSGIVEVNEQ